VLLLPWNPAYVCVNNASCPVLPQLRCTSATTANKALFILLQGSLTAKQQQQAGTSAAQVCKVRCQDSALLKLCISCLCPAQRDKSCHMPTCHCQMAIFCLSTCVLHLLRRRVCGARLTLCRTSWAQDKQQQVGQAGCCSRLHVHQAAVKHCIILFC
jgi:hypothetical protein